MAPSFFFLSFFQSLSFYFFNIFVVAWSHFDGLPIDKRSTLHAIRTHFVCFFRSAPASVFIYFLQTCAHLYLQNPMKMIGLSYHDMSEKHIDHLSPKKLLISTVHFYPAASIIKTWAGLPNKNSYLSMIETQYLFTGHFDSVVTAVG